MSSPYIGEIRICGFSFAPVGWATCDGQLLPISDYDALFTILGTTYGGDGQNTFALPNLCGRVPVHLGTGASNVILGQSGGEESHTLSIPEIPSHSHQAVASSDLAAVDFRSDPTGAYCAKAGNPGYAPASAINGAMAAGSLTSQGGNQPHDNMPPFQVATFIIALYGVFPTQQ